MSLRGMCTGAGAVSVKEEQSFSGGVSPPHTFSQMIKRVQWRHKSYVPRGSKMELLFSDNVFVRSVMTNLPQRIERECLWVCM